jgi:hypothetical protein
MLWHSLTASAQDNVRNVDICAHACREKDLAATPMAATSIVLATATALKNP